MTSDADLRRILTETKVIALVGWSPKPDRPSHRVAAFLHQRGYRVIAVNPGVAGQDSGLGGPVVARLADIAIEKCGFYLPDHARYDYLLNLELAAERFARHLLSLRKH